MKIQEFLGKTIRQYFNWMLYGMFFLFFVYVFYTMPPICDRWMESLTYYSFESPWRYIFSQIRWMQNANARVLSNIFSAIVDRNILVRAIVNSSMLIITINDINEILTYNKRKNRYTNIILLSCLLLMSWGIQKEVYLYATTLFISSVFLMVKDIKYLVDIFFQQSICTKKVFVSVFITSVWLENVGLSIVIVSSLLVLVYFWKNKVIEKRLLGCSIISAIGISIMYLSSRVASMGRLRNGVAVSLNWDRVLQLIYDNICLFIICSVLVLYHLFINRKNWGNKIWNIFQIIFWTIAVCVEIIWGSSKIYAIVSQNPKDAEYLASVFCWETFHSNIAEKIYKIMFSGLRFILPIVLMIGVISLIYVFICLGEYINGIVYFVVCLAGISIDVFNLQEGDRVSFPGIFSILLIISLLVNNFENGKQSMIKFLCGIVVIFSFINAEQLIVTVHQAAAVADERAVIADLVKDRQRLNEWDYSEYVVMPEYESEGEHALLGEGRLQPAETDVYYNILLKYYGLDEKTKIIFSP